MALPILQIKRRDALPTTGKMNGLIEGELGYCFANNALYIGPKGNADGSVVATRITQDYRVSAAVWNIPKDGTTNTSSKTDLQLKLTLRDEYSKNGSTYTTTTVTSGSLPLAAMGAPGIVSATEQTFGGLKIFAGGIKIRGKQPGTIDTADPTRDTTINTNGLIETNKIILRDMEEVTTGAITDVLVGGALSNGSYYINRTSPLRVLAALTSGNGITYNSETGVISHSNAVTAGTASGSGTGNIALNGSITVPTITYDSEGHITGVSSGTVTLGGISVTNGTASKAAAAMIQGISATAGGVITVTKFTGSVGGDTSPIYFSDGVPTAGKAYAGGTAVTLNGSDKAESEASFYAPTGAGTEGQVLSANANGVPSWVDRSTLTSGTLATPRKIDGYYFDGSADVTHYGVCSTAKATAAKVVTIGDGKSFVLEAGARVIVKFSESNSASTPTLNVNGTGAKAMKMYGSTKMSSSSSTNGWSAGAIIPFTYDGSYWVRDYWSNTTYSVPGILCSTEAATATKVSTYGSYFANRTNSVFEITMRYANTAQSKLTLNINSLGAKDIWINGEVSSATNYTLPAGKYLVYFDGSVYHFNTESAAIPGQKITVAGNDIYLGKELSATTLTTSLGLSKALRFIGMATEQITDGSTKDPVISGYDVSKDRRSGDVVIYNGYEYVWTLSGVWELLGGDSSYKVVQSAVAKKGGSLPNVITSIEQNINGEITAASATIKNLSINGQTYNGSSAITVGTIGVGYGGTGATTLTNYGLLLGNGTNAISALTPAEQGYTLIAKGTGAAPMWDNTLFVDEAEGIEVAGYIGMQSKVKFQYNETDKCVDIVFN